ncbi:MAG: hypothetical protein ACQEQI_09230 [Bacillota bacterium]
MLAQLKRAVVADEVGIIERGLITTLILLITLGLLVAVGGDLETAIRRVAEFH